MKKRLLAWMLAMLMLLAVTPVTVLAAQPKQYEVSTLEELLTAVREINRDGGEDVITLKSNIVLDASKWTESDSALSFQNGTTTLLGEGHTLTMDRVGHRGMDVCGSAKLFLGSEGYEQLLALVGSGSSDEEDGVLLNPILNLSGQSEVRIYTASASGIRFPEARARPSSCKAAASCGCTAARSQTARIHTARPAVCMCGETRAFICMAARLQIARAARRGQLRSIPEAAPI